MKTALALSDFLEAPEFYGRREAFKLIADKLLELARPVIIVETGTMRPPREEGRECEDGCSTLLWDWIATETKGSVLSIDIDHDNVEYARKKVSGYTEIVCGDSIRVLSDLSKGWGKGIDLIYLDSCDYKPETAIDSIIHTTGELAAIWPRLNSKGLIVADDFLGPFHGKGALVRLFCEMFTGCMPLFLSNVCCWRKP